MLIRSNLCTRHDHIQWKSCPGALWWYPTWTVNCWCESTSRHETERSPVYATSPPPHRYVCLEIVVVAMDCVAPFESTLLNDDSRDLYSEAMQLSPHHCDPRSIETHHHTRQQLVSNSRRRDIPEVSHWRMGIESQVLIEVREVYLLCSSAS